MKEFNNQDQEENRTQKILEAKIITIEKITELVSAIERNDLENAVRLAKDINISFKDQEKIVSIAFRVCTEKKYNQNWGECLAEAFNYNNKQRLRKILKINATLYYVMQEKGKEEESFSDLWENSKSTFLPSSTRVFNKIESVIINEIENEIVNKVNNENELNEIRNKAQEEYELTKTPEYELIPEYEPIKTKFKLL